MTKKKKIILIISSIIVIAIVLSFVFKKSDAIYTTEKVERKNLKQTVSETGTIKSAEEIDLNFQNNGKIKKILVSVGQRVSSSQILAELNYRDLSIRAKDSQASLDIARANLNKLMSGATSYEIAIKEASVKKAEIEYNSSLNELEEVKRSVLEDAQDAETNAIISSDTNLSKAQISIDNINTILTNEDIKNLLGVRNSSILNLTKTSFEIAKNSILQAKTSLNTARQSNLRSDIQTSLYDTSNALNKTYDALTNCYQTLENSITSSNFSQSELDAYKTIISGQETIISASISSIQGALTNLTNTNITQINGVVSGSQSITNAQSKVSSYYEAWQLAKLQLEQLKAPARNQDVTLYEAQVRQAEASLESIRNQIENSIIRAPIDGIITQIEYKRGELTSISKPAIKMLSENKLEISVDISESDITKVKLDDPAEITLGALSSEQKIYGKVYDINPAETIIQDVIYYKIKISFDIPKELESEIKPGMTADVIITTKNKADTLVIPSRSITEKNGDGKFVKILEDKNVKEISIKTGIYGDDGMVEVLSGLQEGQDLITSINTKK